MNNLEENQLRLQQEAKEVLSELNILSILSSYGEPKIVGSLATGLMTWNDIDIELTNGINEDKYWKIVKQLFHTPKYKRLNIIDFRNSVNPNTPKGLHICISDYLFHDDKPWKIDIWFLEPRQTEENFHAWLQENLKPEHKLPILEIKQQVSSHPKYKYEVFSVDIYKAVIEDNAKNLEDFKKYLAKTNRTLD